MRDESLLTQLKVAKLVQVALGKGNQTADDTILSSYQRIERTGKTSKKMAAALAEVFATTVGILQGGDVPEDATDFVDRIEQQLGEQKKSGKNLALIHALAQRAQTSDKTADEDDGIREFATDLAAQIEVAQIGQDSEEIARLADLTGWSEVQLRKPGGVHGHWILLTTVHGSRDTEIVLGVHDIRYRIAETSKKWMAFSESDVRISLRRSLPWFRVDMVHPRIPAVSCRFSFARCRPEVGGLKWVNPNWRDEFWLEEPLKEWAFSNANFVTALDGSTVPSDVRRLRLRVLERNAKGGLNRVAYSKGHLDDLPEQVFKNFKAEGHGHSIVINWLVRSFAQTLTPHLAAYPREYWTIRAGTCHIAILLDLPIRLLMANRELIGSDGIKFRLDLVEETSPGVYLSAPWRDSSIAEVCSLLEKRVFQTPDDDDQVETLQFLNLPAPPS